MCGNEAIGSRSPNGESPGVRNRLPRRNFQRSLRQRPASAFQRWIGKTKPLGTLRPWSNTRAIRERSSGSDNLESLGSTFGGNAASFCSQWPGSSNAGMMNSESTPIFFAAHSAKRSASSILALRRLSIVSIRSEFFQIGTPELGRSNPGDVPFRRFQLADRNEGRFAAHRQSYVARLQIGIDLLA